MMGEPTMSLDEVQAEPFERDGAESAALVADGNGPATFYVTAETDSDFTKTAAPRPVDAAERVTSVDVLRGFALLGILAMNIVAFAWPGPAYGYPMRGGGFAGTDRMVWLFNHHVFEMKMM